MMTTLAISRGLPGAGKDTWAAVVQSLDPDGTVVSNRDGLRTLLFGSCGQDYYDCSKVILHRKERLVTEAQHADIGNALKAGFNVIVSDTNLPVKRCRDLRAIGTKHGAGFQIVDFTHVSLNECLARNQNRTDKDPVPEEVIRSMYDRYVRGGLAPVPYKRQTGLPNAVIVDTDGTVANHKPHRGPYDTSLYAQDTPFQDVVDVVRAIDQSKGTYIIGMSGRSEDFRDVTEQWWRKQVGVEPDGFYMRPSGDVRKDFVVKNELFEKHVAGRYNVIGVFEDRPSVARMWREKGLTTFQVGDPSIEF